MRLKVAFLLLLASLAGLAGAQEAALTFPSDGDRDVWVASSPPDRVPTDVVKTGKATVSVPLTGKADTDVVYVWDHKTGNLATHLVKDAKNGWDVKPEAFNQVFRTDVSITYGGAPVAAAQVQLDDGARKQSQLLDPSTKGVVSFFAVKPGSVRVTVNYRSKGEAAAPVTQVAEIGLNRNDPVPTISVAVPGPVEVVGAAQTAPTAPASPAPAGAGPDGKAVPTGSPFGTLLTVLVGLIVLGGIAWLALRYYRENPDQVNARLEKLGVQVPKPVDDPITAADPIPAAPKAPEPPQKIILDGAAPDPIASVGPSSAMTGPILLSGASAGGGVPRLVSESGDVLNLDEGETVVGREAGLGLSLVGESTVSRQHARLARQGSEVTLTDLGSTNGTYVNGAKLTGQTRLRPGDQVQFGSIRFRYEG